MKRSVLIFLISTCWFFTNPIDNAVSADDQKIKVLAVLDDDFGVSYPIPYQKILSIKEKFESYGWEITVAGVKDTLRPCEWSQQNFKNAPIEIDIKISDILNITGFNAMIIMPGNSHKNLIQDKDMLSLISEADKNNLVLAAWCRGVRVLAAAGVLSGKTVVGNIDYAAEYEKAGAHYIQFYKKGIRDFFDVTPPIADGNIITTVRSLYYRNQMCERIKQVVESNVAVKTFENKIVLNLQPSWSHESGFLSTGIAWSDMNQDGWLDLIVSNGIDAADQPALAYKNNRGKMELNPGWKSDYVLPSGNLFLADLNGDQFPELLISHLGQSRKGFQLGSHVLYSNSNDSGFSALPEWKSPKANGFSCTGGDFDGDGDMDLVFGQGVNAIKPKDKKYQKTVLYLNNNGNFNSIPDWESEKEYLTNDVCAIDIDNDGDLDLCISGKGFGVSVFYNTNGQLERSPSWFTNSILGARQMAFGDVDGDGFQELAVAVPAPKFLSVGGKFCLFKNNKGILEKEPFWECALHKEPSCVVWADVDSDGDLDLTGGGLFGYLGVFDNKAGVLSEDFSWSYQGDPRRFNVQQIAWGDYDKDYIVNEVKEIKIDGKRKLFYIGKKNLQDITAVLVNDKPVPLKKFCYDLNEGWFSLAQAPSNKGRLTVVYSYSRDLDLAVNSLHRTDIFDNEVVQ